MNRLDLRGLPMPEPLQRALHAADALEPGQALQVLTALPPIGLFAFGWALVVPAVTLLVLDLVPERRGMASSLQAFIGALANGVVAGIVVPLVMHSTKTLALASALLTAIGVLSWLWVSGRVAAGGARAGAH